MNNIGQIYEDYFTFIEENSYGKKKEDYLRKE